LSEIANVLENAVIAAFKMSINFYKARLVKALEDQRQTPPG
jgi:hypothetical protein